MPFDKTLPTNTTKIRNYPTVLTDNFAGIQEGELTFKMWQLNFADRDLVAGAPPPTQDPTRDNDTMIMFSKQDAVNAETELFLMDDQNPANIIQLSEDGNIGSGTTDFIVNNFRFGTNATTYDQGNIVKARGTVSATGVLSGGSNITSTSGGAGLYTINVAADVLEVGSSYQVLATAVNTGTLFCTVITKAVPVALAVTAITLNTRRGDNGALLASVFDIMIIGGV